MSSRACICAFVAALLCISVCSAATLADNVEERAALLGFLKANGLELRDAPNRSNVISHMYSIGPQHEKQWLVGLSWYEQAPTPASIYAKSAINIPFVLNGHWALWRVGGPGGNATDAYMPAWNRALGVFSAYVAPR
jgi:hypothetical protein